MTPTKLLTGTVFSVLAVAVGGVWFATEWAAWHLAFQRRLGAPWFTFFDYPVYPVWALFVCWYAYDAYAPTIFNEAGDISALGGVVGCGVAITGSLWRAYQSKHVTTYGSSRWATDLDIAEAGLFDPSCVFLGRFDRNYLRHNGPGTSELGTAWARRGSTGEHREYLSVRLDEPSLPMPTSAAPFHQRRQSRRQFGVEPPAAP